MTKAKLISVLLIVLVAGACDSKKDPAALSDEQKARLTGTLDSLGRAQDAVRFAKSGGAQRGTISFNSLQSLSEPGDTVTTQMSSSLNQGQCTITASGYDTIPGGPASSDIKLTASGAACPIDMNLALTVGHTQTASLTETKGSISCDYKVKDPSYASYNDIDSISETGSFQKSLAFGSGGAFSLNGSISVKGTAHSRQYGAIIISIDGQMSGSSMNLTSQTTYNIQFSDTAFQLSTAASSNSNGLKTSYYLNGAVISQTEFEGYIARAGALLSAGMDK